MSIQSFLSALKGKSYLEPHVALGRSDLIINILDSEWVVEANEPRKTKPPPKKKGQKKRKKKM
jgi:hypothetical protein